MNGVNAINKPIAFVAEGGWFYRTVVTATLPGTLLLTLSVAFQSWQATPLVKFLVVGSIRVAAVFTAALGWRQLGDFIKTKITA